MNFEPIELRKASLKITLPPIKILQMIEASADRHLSLVLYVKPKRN